MNPDYGEPVAAAKNRVLDLAEIVVVTKVIFNVLAPRHKRSSNRLRTNRPQPAPHWYPSQNGTVILA